MNTIFMSGAEQQVTNEFGDLPPSTEQARSGAASYKLTYAVNYTYTMPSSVSEGILGVGVFFPDSTLSTFNFLTLKKGSDIFLGLYQESDALKVKLFNTTTIISGPAMYIGDWNYIEVYYKIDGTNGVIYVWLNNSLIGTFSGDTLTGTVNTVNIIGFLGTVNSGVYIDDVILNTIDGDIENCRPRGAKIVLIKPNSDVGSPLWTPSTPGNHYSLIDDVPQSITDNVSTQSSGQIDRFGLEDIPEEAKAIVAIKCNHWSKRLNTTAPNAVKVGCQKGGTDYMFDADAVDASVSLKSHIRNTDPETGLEFIPSDLNSINAVIESV